jgi:nicotinamidase-related amidase
VGFDDMEYWGGRRNNPDAEAKASYLVQAWREQRLPIFHIQYLSTNPHSRLAPGNPGHEIKKIVQPEQGEPVIKKSVNSAFIGTDLKE